MADRLVSIKVMWFLSSLILLGFITNRGPNVIASITINQVNIQLSRALIQANNSTEQATLLSEALESAEQSIRISPSRAQAYMSKGRILLLQNHPEASLIPLASAASLIPTNDMAHLLYGDGLDRAGKRQEAIAQWAQGQLIEKYHLQLAYDFSQQQDFSAAEIRYRIAIDIAHAKQNRIDEAAGYRGLGDLARAQKQFDLSVKYYEIATELVPNDPLTRAGLAQALQNAERIAEAYTQAHLSLNQQPNWLAHLVLGELYLRRGYSEEAADEFEASIRLNPKDPWGPYILGSIRAQQGDTQTAIQLWQQALTVDPTFVHAQRALDDALASTSK